MAVRVVITMALLAALVAPVQARGDGVLAVTGDQIAAIVTPDPFRLRIVDASGDDLLAEVGPGARPGFGGLSFSYGFHRGGMLGGLLETGSNVDLDLLTFVPTRVESATPVEGGLRLTLATDDFLNRHRLVVTITAGGPRRLSVEAALDRPDPFVSRVGAAFAARPGEHYAGFGQKMGPGLDQRGQQFAIGASRRFRTPEFGGLPLPLPDFGTVPWFVSSMGYGVAVRSYGNGVAFDMASRGDVTRWSVPAVAGPLAFDVYAGDPATVVTDYTAGEGRPMLMPEWSAGIWRGADVYPDRAAALADRDRFRELGLPLDALVIDSPWETQYNSWVPNPNQWGDFASMLADLNASGVNPVLWTTGWQNVDSTKGDVVDDEQSQQWAREPAAPFADLQSRGLLVQEPDGSPYLFDWWMGRGASIDFTTEAGRQAWRELIVPTLRLGVRGVKTDGMEGFYFDDDVRFGDGTTGAQSAWANLLGYRQATMDALAEVAGDDGWALMGRSATHGVQGQAITWAGDQFSTITGLWEVVQAGLSSALTGISNYTHDVGGYIGRPPTLGELAARFATGWRPKGIFDLIEGFPPRPEVLVRWAQVGAVSSSFLYFSKAFAQPWNYDAETFAALKDAMVLHETLVPQLRAAALQAHETGMPAWRPLPLVAPGEERAWTTWDEWMVGDDLLVAPVLTEGARRRSVWLPPGEWVDFWSGERRDGDVDVEVDAPLGRLPLFVRAGAVLARYPGDVTSLTDAPGDPRAVTPRGRLDVTVYPGEGEGPRTLRLAGGGSFEAAADGTSLSWSGEVGTSLLVRLPAPAAPSTITAAGSPLAGETCAAVAATRSGWCHDAGAGLVVAGVPAAAGDVTLG